MEEQTNNTKKMTKAEKVQANLSALVIVLFCFCSSIVVFSP